MFIFLFWESESKLGRGRERQTDRIWRRLQALSCQHRAWHGAQTHGPRDRDLAEVRRLTDCATQAPQLLLFLMFNFWERGRGREKETEDLKRALRWQQRARRGAQTHEPWGHALSRRQTLNRLSHAGIPSPYFLTVAKTEICRERKVIENTHQVLTVCQASFYVPFMFSSLPQPCRVDTVAPGLQIRKAGCREVKYLTQGCTATSW